ncbi:non-ribosomal peptide synthetase [Kiloniella laminariae]|uniref:non-ribosomal peptide synthetase n=1 Tax=Kiloniella laminariae TaxID=454162 RepID=UPI0003631D05|nr:non-ribosomal peptide synthetase [Kiloniella laminariae]
MSVTQSLIATFKAVCARHANSPAVRENDHKLDYRELDELSDRIARNLVLLGISKGHSVGLFQPRSLHLPALILAVLKLGANYVPIDPNAPASRQKICLEEADVKLLVCQKPSPDLGLQQTTLTDLLKPDTAGFVSLPETDPGHLACILFTSGSTGTPKGVEIEQAGILRTTANPDYLEILPGTRFANLSNPTFDALTFELFGALLNGGTLVIFSQEQVTDPFLLAQGLQQEKIDTLFLTAALFNVLVDLSPNCLGTARDVLVGGEPLRPASVAAFFQANPKSTCRLHNGYGPTECTTFSLTHQIHPTKVQQYLDTGNIPIGTPIDATAIHIIGDDGAAVPEGATGMLYIGGAGLARGYCNNPERTAESFVSLPAITPDRLYLTGDLVRRNSEDLIEFIGRQDGQIKVRGHRIELAEIENLLAQHPEVSQVCLTCEQDQNSQRLTAYLVGKKACDLTRKDFRQFLSLHLPPYMIPQQFFQIDTLPRTANDKVDRNQLSRSDAKAIGREEQDVEISDSLLSSVLEICREVLGYAIKAEEAFIAAGGDSLAAMRIIGKIRQQTSHQATVGQLLGASSISAFIPCLVKQDLLPALSGPLTANKAYPAAPEQNRLLFLQRLIPDSIAYNAPFVFDVTGSLSIGTLEKALMLLVARHPVLRTIFEDRNGISYAVPRENTIFELKQCDTLSAAQDYCDQPFDLGKDLMVRAALAPTASEQHRLFLCFHHIAIDGQSINLLFADLSALYSALQQNTAAPELSGKAGYADFAAARQLFNNSPAARDQLQNWRKRLEPALSGRVFTPLFATKFTDKSTKGGTGDFYEYTIEPQIWEPLIAFTRSEGITLFSLLLSAFSLPLAQLTGRDDIAIGTPLANRGLGEFENIVGMCVNSLPCHLPLKTKGSLRTLLHQTHKHTTEIFQDLDIDFDNLASLFSKRSQENPLFDVMIVLENTRPETLQLPGTQTTAVTYSNGSAKFPLTLFITERDKGAHLVFEYNNALLTLHQVKYLASGLEVLLSKIPTVLNQSVADISLLPTAITQQLESWEGSTVPDDPSDDLITRFQQQVDRRPAFPAIQMNGSDISYHDLAGQVDHLVQRLKKRGLGSGHRIGLCFDRSPEMIVALLAVLKSGAAYVPLDPAYPGERLNYLVEDSDISLILTHGKATDKAGAFLANCDVETLLLDQKELEKDPEEANPLSQSPVQDPTIAAEDTAYVMYTSGSTGLPKGVIISHSALANYLEHANQQYCQQIDLAIVSSSLNFDATITTLLAPLYSGKTIQLLPQDGKEVEALARLLNKTTKRLLLKITPSHLWALRGYLETAPSTTAHCFVIGGESFPWVLASHYRTLFPKAEIINEYGPTETVVGCSVYALPKEDLSSQISYRDVPIGQPIANTQIKILNARGKRCSIGIPGEIFIGGAGVGQGYFRRSDLTGERFPTLRYGKRYYASGDFGFWSEDGQLHFIGRRDEQLKVRGYRIETAEVESHLLSLPDVEQAAVAVKTSELGDTRFIGYIVTKNSNLTSATLREQLQKILPSHMIPDSFVHLDQLPFTPNGKLDREALPLAPQPAIETPAPQESKKLQTLLGNEINNALGYEVDPDMNFFEAGMNSLLLMKVHSELKSKHKLDLELVDFFTYSNISSLGSYLGNGQIETEQLKEEKKAGLEEEIAIIGMAVHLPNAPDLVSFWEKIQQGDDCISHNNTSNVTSLTENRTSRDSLPGATDRHRVSSVSSMDGLFDFDPAYFGLTASEAEVMDPQQRHILMGAVHALENAGLPPTATTGRVAVVVSSSENRYQQAILKSGAAPRDGFQMSLLNEKDFVSSRIAYHLNLNGPALTVQSACSSSLSAIHIACQQLRLGESDIALAGGVSADPEHLDGYEYRQGRIYSRDGRCRSFSQEASGTVPANGMGMVVLKPLSKALADNDRIYATIKGSAINNDGRDKVSFFAPSVKGQSSVITQAMTNAGVAAEQISYVEAHGTATEIGDPIEVEALTRAHRKSSSKNEHKNGYCALATVKSQMGHLAAAAGVVGLIRTALGLYHSILPPSIGIGSANERIAFDSSPFYLNKTARHWPGQTRIAGVSSFGMGGTNAHFILSSALQQVKNRAASAHFIPFSAKSPTALRCSLENAFAKLSGDLIDLQELATIQNSGKRHYPCRAGFLCQSREEALARLSDLISGKDMAAPDQSPQGNNQDLRWLAGENPTDSAAHGRLPLDTLPYPFDKKEYRFTPAIQEIPSAGLRAPKEQWLYQQGWTSFQQLQASEQRPQTLIGIGLPADLNGMMAAHCQNYHSSSPENLPVLLADLPRNTDIAILFVTEPTDENALLTQIEILQAWTNQRKDQPLDFTLITSGTAKLSPGEQLVPQVALLNGPLLVTAAEHPNIQSRLIDVEPGELTLSRLLSLLDNLSGRNGHFALRGDTLYSKTYSPMLAPRFSSPRTHKGVYLVIGGLGGIGQHVMDHFSQHEQVTLVSLSRSGTSRSLDPENVKKWGKADHYALTADIGKPQDVRAVAEELQQHFGQLTGIVHLAGQAGGGLLSQNTSKSLKQGLAAKVTGLQNLERYLLPLSPEFVLCFSSMSAVFGLPGQSDYAAANSYMDAWAENMSRKVTAIENPARFISINWPTWAGTGMAAHHVSSSVIEKDYALTAAEGLEMMEVALSLGLPRLLISPVELRKIEEHLKTKNRKSRDSSPSGNTPPDSVSAAFTKVLGLEELDEEMDFYDLGGDSLSALDLLDLLDPLYPGKLTLADILKLGSASAIHNYLTAESDADKPIGSASSPNDESLVLLRSGAAPSICCIHPIGGDLSGYRPLVSHLPAFQQVQGFRDPVLANPQAQERSVEELAQHYLELLGDKLPESLVGWSFGALIAWDMARQLEQQGRPLPSLVLIDPPVIGQQQNSTFDANRVFLQELAQAHPDFADKSVLQNQSSEKITRLPSLGDSYIEAVMSACARNATAMTSFHPKAQISARTTLVIAAEGEKPEPGYSNRHDWLQDSWQKYFKFPLASRVLPGDHYTVMTGTNAIQIADLILTPDDLFLAQESSR